MKKTLQKLRHFRAAKLAKTVLRMKLTAILIIASCFQVYATGYSQDAKVTLNLHNASISSVLKSIERKTDYKFVYSSNFFPSANTVSVTSKIAMSVLCFRAFCATRGLLLKEWTRISL